MPSPSLQSSKPTYIHLRELFTIQPSRSTRSSFYLTLSRPPVPSNLMFSNRAISTSSLELRTISLPHHRYCQLQDIIFIRLLYPSPPVLSLKTEMLSLQNLIPWLT